MFRRFRRPGPEPLPRSGDDRRGKSLVALGVVLLVSIVLVSGCGGAPAPPAAAPTAPPPAAAPTPAGAPPPAAAPAATTPVPAKPVVDQAVIRKVWEGSPHNNRYDLYKGPNTYCARCHSPRNWDPAATVGKPPNCFSCKFPTDKEVRISPLAPLIPEANWKVIGCDVCHQVDDKGVASAKIGIWNNGTGKYDAVASTTALCEKCHTDSLGGTRHKIRLGGGAHSNQIGTTARRPEACTDCHDPHSLKADCAMCHAKALKPEQPIAGHDAAHANVTCVACHDASGMKVVKVEGKNILSTGTTSVTGGREVATPAYSHDFKRGVDCVRCHYPDNPWKLRSLVTPTPVPATKPNPTPTR